MRLGVAIPQTDIGCDPKIMSTFAQEAERIGFQHLATYDHVLGANVENRPNWEGPYTSEHSFHDTFVLFGFLSAVTKSIEFTTQILILPQRQAVLAAKQAASVDLISGGRLRLGVGTGWNPVEYIGLNKDFNNRGIRLNEQLDLMKKLWTNPHINFEGKWHNILDAGINPLPMQKPIPIWIGGSGEKVFKRIAKFGDGWITLYHQPDEEAKNEIKKLSNSLKKEGRNLSEIGIDAWVSMGGNKPSDWKKEIIGWKNLGVTHITLNTAFNAFHHKGISGKSLDNHLSAIQNYYETVSDLL